MDVGGLLEKVVPALVTGAGTAFLAAWRFTAGLLEKVDKHHQLLDKHHETLEKIESGGATNHEAVKLHLGELRRDLTETKAAIRAELKREIDSINRDLMNRSRERVDARRLSTRLTERFMALESRVDRTEKAFLELESSFEAFTKEQREEWQTMTRTLGKVEGYLQGLRKNSGFQSS